MASGTSSSTLVGGKGKTKRLGMTTRAVSRQLPPAAQKPPIQEDGSSGYDDTESDTPKPRPKQKKQPPTQEDRSSEYDDSESDNPTPRPKKKQKKQKKQSPIQEDRSSEYNNTESDNPTPRPKRKKQPLIPDDTIVNPPPPPQESSPEPPNLEGVQRDSKTIEETITAIKKEITNLTYKIIRAEHHYQFAKTCGEKQIIPTGLDYTKKNINVMKSPRDEDNQNFQDIIKDIQLSASRLTRGAMETYYEQLTVRLQTELAHTNDKLSQAMLQFKQVAKEEEWATKQRTQREFEDSLTNKQDKFSEKLTNKRAKKLEKLENPGTKPRPPRNTRNKRNHNNNNKGKSTQKQKPGDNKQKSSTGNKNKRKGARTAPQKQDTHHQGTREYTPRASMDQTAYTTYPSTQPTLAYPPYYASQIPTWPYPPAMPQMAPWAPGFQPAPGAPRPPGQHREYQPHPPPLALTQYTKITAQNPYRS